MVESMIERVARAIMEARGGCNVTDWREAKWNPAVEQSLNDARAAIEAMREPTDAMVDTGQWQIDPVSLYQSFIDAALNEQVSG